MTKIDFRPEGWSGEDAYEHVNGADNFNKLASVTTASVQGALDSLAEDLPEGLFNRVIAWGYQVSDEEFAKKLGTSTEVAAEVRRIHEIP